MPRGAALSGHVPARALASLAPVGLVAAGEDADRERARALVRAHCGFDETGAYRPDYGSPASDPAGRAPRPEDRADLDALAGSFAPPVESAARRAMEVLHAELSDVVRRGEIVLRPADTAAEVDELRRSGPRETRAASSYSTCFLQEGWFVAITIDSNTRPGFGHAMHELYDVRLERDRALRQSIAALP